MITDLEVHWDAQGETDEADEKRHGVSLNFRSEIVPVESSKSLLEAYEAHRDILPKPTFPNHYERLRDLEELTERYDAFFFDAFGVLNIGETAIEKAADRISAVKRAGRQVRIVSNAGSVPVSDLHKKYTRLGFDFEPDEIISSRIPLVHHLRVVAAQYWGVMAPAGADVSDLGVETVNLVENPDAFDDVDGFILLSASGWTTDLQQRLLSSLQAHERPVLLANPDIAAPREHGFSIEPGQLANSVRANTDSAPLGFGKPYKTIFDIALAGLQPQVEPHRVLMIGDTLHTDVLGGCGAGLHTALVTAQGASAALDWPEAVRVTGIVPHYVLDHI